MHVADRKLTDPLTASRPVPGGGARSLDRRGAARPSPGPGLGLGLGLDQDPARFQGPALNTATYQLGGSRKAASFVGPSARLQIQLAYK